MVVVGFQASRGEVQGWVSLERCAFEARQPIHSVYFLAEDSFNSEYSSPYRREDMDICFPESGVLYLIYWFLVGCNFVLLHG